MTRQSDTYLDNKDDCAKSKHFEPDKNNKNTRQQMHMNGNTNIIIYWNIPRNNGCELKPSHQLHSCQTAPNIPRDKGCQLKPSHQLKSDPQYAQKTTHNKSCWFGFINGTGFMLYSTVYKPSQITLNAAQSEIINVVKDEAMDRNLIKTNYCITDFCFRSISHKMTGKSVGAQKPPQTGTPPVVKSSLPGATTTPPPPAKPTPSPPGAPTKATSPVKNTGSNKTEKSGGN